MSSITTVDGLISGLNTTDIISKLMQVEAQPQTALKTKLAAQQNVITAFQSVNTKLAALQKAAEALGGNPLTSLTGATAWQGVAATSSATSVSATAAAGAPVGQYTFDVTSLARTHIMTVQLAGDEDAVVSGGALQISINGAMPPVPIVVSDNNPQGTADAINSANLGIRASVVTTSQGRVLQLSATQTGAEHSFAVVDGFLNPAQLLSQGTDASITVGDPNAGGYTVTSPTNTLTGVPPGVTLTVSKKETAVSISVAADSSGLADSMQKMVDAANGALADIKAKTTYDAASKAGGALVGNLGVQQLQQRLLAAVSSATTSGGYSKLGVQLGSDGTLTFDKAAFLAAYQTNPDSTKTAISTGLAGTLASIAKSATDSSSGSITLAVQGSNDRVRALNTQIANWDVRLASRQAALKRQYSGLEVALGRLKDQSNWLAGQIANLGTG